MRTVLFIPPLARMSGGLAALYSLADALRAQGRSVALTCPGAKGAGFAEAAAGAETLPWEGLRLEPADLWVVPESWPNAISLGVQAGARTLVYAQSWNFLLTTLPQGVRWKQLPVEYLAVSHPVAWFMREVLELPVLGVLPPAVHPVFFTAGEQGRGARPLGRVRVAWMPRKNRALAELIQQIALARLAALPVEHSVTAFAPAAVRGLVAPLPGKSAGLAPEGSFDVLGYAAQGPARGGPVVEWVPVQNMGLEEVAATLASCHCFLATAFPEGFGLPPLEAMATGCVPVGFTGFGGWEYMRQANWEGESALWEKPCVAVPPFALPERPFAGNGLFFADGDVMGAGLGLAGAVRAAHVGAPEFLASRAAGQETARLYDGNCRARVIEGIWNHLAGGRPRQSGGGADEQP